MKKANIPIISGSNGSVDNIEEAINLVKEIGYPILIKSSFGGGGKGIRVVYNNEELKNSLI